MQIEERLERLFTTMENYEFGLKVIIYVGAILIAYNYFFYLSLVGMVIGIPLYIYIQTTGIRSVQELYRGIAEVASTKNTVTMPTVTMPTVATAPA